MTGLTFAEERQILQEKIEKTRGLDFAELALSLFDFQAKYNSLYAEYLKLLGISAADVSEVENIPFLPIQFFKSHQVKTGSEKSIMTFTSSGTTSKNTAKHFVTDPDFYLRICKKIWAENYESIENYCVLALLPAYLERKGSSLIFMMQEFIKTSTDPDSDFFLHDTERLLQIIHKKQRENKPVLLLGVTFALLDLAENYAPDLSGITVAETGGMKGRRKELTRAELHDFLCKSFKINKIHSEYGMTELFSQAYSKGNGIFQSSSTLRVFTREITDPLSSQKIGKTGAINIIDLANIDSCAFIATDDLGKVYADGSFEILGRLDASDVRGCNLLVI